MSTRFEILKNGKRICISGINGDGVLSVGVTYVKRPGEELTHDLKIGGLGRFDGSRDQSHHASWPAPDIETGDEITIRLLEEGEYDTPEGMRGSPQKTIDDPEFGQLNYYVDSWDAEIDFDCPPIDSAHLHVCADESGISQVQRDLIGELKRRHTRLWPQICSALVKCHPDIETTEQMLQRISGHIGVNIYDDSNTIEITYRVQGDPEYRGYFVTLRNWIITEICTTD